VHFCPREGEGDSEAGRALCPLTRGWLHSTHTRKAEQVSDRNQSQPAAQ